MLQMGTQKIMRAKHLNKWLDSLFIITIIILIFLQKTTFSFTSLPHYATYGCKHHADSIFITSERNRIMTMRLDKLRARRKESTKTNSKNKNIAIELDSDLVNDFCQGTNSFWKGLVLEPVRRYVEIQPAGTSKGDALSKLIAPPEVPGIPRPVWLTILGSVPTALGWYGYYKFSIEEELFQYELKEEGKVSGCGGYGTLFPFVFGILIGFPLQLFHMGGDKIVDAAALWILAGQVNLYRRVNELCEEEKTALGIREPPLYEWWAFLPPPLDVVVGLRQVHFLSEFWRIKRGDAYEKDLIAEELFPFISCERFTLKEFFRTPSKWFWFTKDWKDFDYDFLKE